MKEHLDKVQQVLDHNLTKRTIKVATSGLKVFKVANMIKSAITTTLIWSLIFSAGWFTNSFISAKNLPECTKTVDMFTSKF
jgi:hypothetical protein